MTVLLSKLLSFASGIPWVKIGIVASLISVFIYGVHVIKTEGAQKEIIQQLEIAQKEKDARAQEYIKAIRVQYDESLKLAQKEKEDAISLAKKTQTQLDRIKAAPASSNGPTKPVINDTLKWLHDHRNDSNAADTNNKATE